MTIASSNGTNGAKINGTLNGTNGTTSVTAASGPVDSDSPNGVKVPVRPDRTTTQGKESKLYTIPDNADEAMVEAVRTMLIGVGEDPEREGLLKTPKRVADAMRF
ncbi:MAG: GTP cyclohydrolase I, partial [Elainella sp.]